jgi:curved DNA-binding protein CbpA
MDEARWEPRQSKAGHYSLTWRGLDGNTYSSEASGRDISSSGVGLECSVELKAGCVVYVQARDGSVERDCEVVHCTRRGAKFHVGFEFREEVKESAEAPFFSNAEEARLTSEPDYYETLQISSKADLQTIHRVFRIMASRFHPDNPETGDMEQFLRMKQAYSVLSDPDRRLEYDAVREKTRDAGPRAIFALKDFVTGVEAESNRRLGVLTILYNKRLTNSDHPGVSLLDLEKEMGFPREYLSFTVWYLRAKDFVTVADNSDYALTAAGADYVETKAVHHEIAGKLLNAGAARFRSSGRTAKSRQKTGSQTDRRFLLPASPPVPSVR